MTFKGKSENKRLYVTPIKNMLLNSHFRDHTNRLYILYNIIMPVRSGTELQGGPGAKAPPGFLKISILELIKS